MHIVYAELVTEQHAVPVHNLHDILSVTSHGGQKLETFLNNWDSVSVGMDSILAAETLYVSGRTCLAPQV